MNHSDNEQVQQLKKAVAIFFDGDNTPVVVAKGHDEFAEDILNVANESEVPIVDNELLVEFLSQMEVGDSIPPELYQAVACILSFAYKTTIDDLCAQP